MKRSAHRMNMRQITDVTCFLHQRCRDTFKRSVACTNGSNRIFTAKRSKRTRVNWAEFLHFFAIEVSIQVVACKLTHLPSVLCCWRVWASAFFWESKCSVTNNEYIVVGFRLKEIVNCCFTAVAFKTRFRNDWKCSYAACPYECISFNRFACFKLNFVANNACNRNASNKFNTAFSQAFCCALDQMIGKYWKNFRTSFDQLDFQVMEWHPIFFSDFREVIHDFTNKLNAC